MAAQESRFQIGSQVRIVEAATLRAFQQNWQWHNKLQTEQLNYAGVRAEVTAMGYYFGGDVLYQLAGVPGVWHEQCLEE